MFSKKLAGIGAVAALVGSALVPSVAFADPTPDPTAPPEKQFLSVTVTKNVVVNDEIDASGDVFAFTVTPVTENVTGEDLWHDSTGIELNLQSLTIPNNAETVTSQNIMPTDMSVFTGGPGLYEWIVVENGANSTIDAAHTVRFDGVSYRVKAYVVRNAQGNLEYKAVTAVQLTDNSGGPLQELVKVGDDPNDPNSGDLVFENVYEDTPPDDPGDPDDPSDDTYGLSVTKHVVNEDGLTDEGPYEIEVTFGWPLNFDGDSTWTGNVPNIGIADSSVLAGNADGCSPDEANNQTVCTVTLGATRDADVTVAFTGVPVGATYTVDEKTTGSFTTSGDGVSGTVSAAGGAHVTVTNTYEPTTPTGVMLAVLPYVLMIGIPLLAIAGYIALRRKMNL